MNFNKYFLAASLTLFALSCKNGRVETGDRITLAYKITDTLGVRIDESILDDDFENLDPSDVFAFVVGNHEVVPGWDRAVINCKKNIVYERRVPYQQAYRNERIYHDIPPQRDLLIEFKIIEIEKAYQPNSKTSFK